MTSIGGGRQTAVRVFLLRSQRQRERRRIARSPARRTAKRAQQAHPHRQTPRVRGHDGLPRTGCKSPASRGRSGGARADAAGAARQPHRIRASRPATRSPGRATTVVDGLRAQQEHPHRSTPCANADDGCRVHVGVARRPLGAQRLRLRPGLGPGVGRRGSTPRWTRSGSSSGARLAVRRAGERRGIRQRSR